MADEGMVLGAITSDKVETDNTNFATIKANQVCEEPLIPRENAFRQLDWSVTLEKGAVYNPQEDVGIYAKEVECKYGAQIDGNVYGRDSVVIEHGGSTHTAAEGEGDETEENAGKIGARIIGSVISEGSIKIEAPSSEMEDWTERPVEVYGDIIGAHIDFEEPTVVYGNVKADRRLRSDAEVIVLGNVHSGGSLDVSNLFAFSVSAEDDVDMGKRNVVVNPTVLSKGGKVKMEEDIGVLDSATLARAQEERELDSISVGNWLFEEDAAWEGRVLKPIDVSEYSSQDGDEGEVASLSWRTVNESPEDYEFVRSLLEQQMKIREDPPEIEEMRYSGMSTGGLSKIEKTEVKHEGEGDIVTGTQNKQVEKEDMTKIDKSVTQVDKSTEVYDRSTTVEDSVLNRSEVSGDSDGTEEKQEEEVTRDEIGSDGEE